MNDLYNNIVETEARIILLLSVYEGCSLNADGVTAVDFMAVYPGEFGLADENLNGDSIFKYSEITARIAMVDDALKSLFRNGLLESDLSHGIQYRISEKGKEYVSGFCSTYASEYLENVQAVKRAYGNYTGAYSGKLLSKIITAAENNRSGGGM